MAGESLIPGEESPSERSEKRGSLSSGCVRPWAALQTTGRCCRSQGQKHGGSECFLLGWPWQVTSPGPRRHISSPHFIELMCSKMQKGLRKVLSTELVKCSALRGCDDSAQQPHFLFLLWDCHTGCDCSRTPAGDFAACPATSQLLALSGKNGEVAPDSLPAGVLHTRAAGRMRLEHAKLESQPCVQLTCSFFTTCLI